MNHLVIGLLVFVCKCRGGNGLGRGDCPNGGFGCPKGGLGCPKVFGVVYDAIA
jgi:hypothetical protein